MSASQPETGMAALPDFSSMTEDEQIAYAMQMSLAGGGSFTLCTFQRWSKLHGANLHTLKHRRAINCFSFFKTS